MANAILFPTDFSAPANNALRFVLPFAKKLQARIILMHAYTVPTPIMDAPFYAWEEEFKRQEALVLQQLESIKETILKDHPELVITSITSMGFPVPSILIAAEKHGTDWIVMGTKGASGLKKVFLGSVAAQVIGRSKVPVLAIPETEELPEIHRIVYATNYELSEIEALRRITRLAERYDAEVLIAHVFVEDGSPPVERWESFEAVVRAQIPYPKLSFKFVPHYELKEALAELLNYTGAEILAMCPQKRSLLDRLFHPSKTKAMAYQTRTPLLAIPEA
ncbi:MAG: universal stress protein [Bacteroidia bacterium]